MPLDIINLSAIDSNNIWFDYHRDLSQTDPRWLYHFNGQLSERKYFGYQGILVETTVDPSMAFKTLSGVAYFL